MKRVLGLIAVGLTGAAAAVVPALGANVDVNAGPGQSWSPATVTVSTGDTVTFRNQNAGTHDLAFDDGAPGTAAGTSWTVVRAFNTAGTYVFRCTLHQPSMTGQVVVNAASSTGTTTGTTDTTPTTTSPYPTTTTTTTPAAATVPTLGVALVRRTSCNRRGRACRRPGIALRLTAGEPLTVSGPLRRRGRAGRYVASGRVSLKAAAGVSTVRLRRRADGSLIGRGRYRLTLRGARADGTASASTTLVFTVRG